MKMKFVTYSNYLNEIEKESSRNRMVEILSSMFKELEVEEFKPAIYMLMGRVAPIYLPVEFNFSIKLLLKALSKYLNYDKDEILSKYKEIGDIGELVKGLVKENSKGMDISSVFNDLLKIAETKGKKSQSLKEDIYIYLLKGSGKLEAKYITRMLGGDMRIGLSIKSIFDALSIFLKGDKGYSDSIERAYGLKADLGLLGMMIKENGIVGLDIHPVCGVPVASKLVEREKDPEAIIKRMGECFVQPKYDGLRVQIHYNKKGFETVNDLPLIEGDIKRVKVFSRNMEDLTMMLPDVIKIIETLDVESVILDGEAIGVDKISGLYMSFQDTIKRKRKHDIDRMSMDYPLQVNVFDVIELNGEDMTNKALRERLLVLENIMDGKENNMFKLSDSILVKSNIELKRLFKKYTDKGLEGIVAKEINSNYDPGTRNYTWIKLKASSNKDMVDSVDAVIMGYYLGEGSRNRLGFGALLAGVYDKNIDKFVSLAKVGTGLTEKGIERYKEKLDEFIVNKLPKEYLISKGLMPDVLVMPKIVISIEADSISKSKTHGGGYSLRFPRLIEFGRDRDPFDTTSIIELEEMAKLKN